MLTLTSGFRHDEGGAPANDAQRRHGAGAGPDPRQHGLARLDLDDAARQRRRRSDRSTFWYRPLER